MIFHYQKWDVPNQPLCELDHLPKQLVHPFYFYYVDCPMCLDRLVKDPLAPIGENNEREASAAAAQP